MKVVLDTNILLVSIPTKSRYHPIFEAFLKNKISLAITTAIFLEYQEILNEHSTKAMGEYICESFLAASNIVVPEIYYNWNLISGDLDDNKFTDAYIAAEANYLVTNDRHFNEVKNLKFPPINIVTANEFLEIVKSL